MFIIYSVLSCENRFSIVFSGWCRKHSNAWDGGASVPHPKKNPCVLTAQRGRTAPSLKTEYAGGSPGKGIHEPKKNRKWIETGSFQVPKQKVRQGERLWLSGWHATDVRGHGESGHGSRKSHLLGTHTIQRNWGLYIHWDMQTCPQAPQTCHTHTAVGSEPSSLLKEDWSVKDSEEGVPNHWEGFISLYSRN